MKSLESGESISKNIIAKEFWNHTGIKLEAGNTYSFEIIPKEQVWSDGKLAPQVTDADGFENPLINVFNSLKRMRGEKWFALIGCIDEKESTFFKIGNSCPEYKPSETGELVCFANDADEHYKNNRGVMMLTIKRIS